MDAGPSDAARAKAILKRQRKAGKVLAGRAAKLKRRADLVSRGVDDEKILDDLVAAVGLPGQIFYVNGSNSDKLPKLPGNMQVRVSLGERDACAASLAFCAHFESESDVRRDLVDATTIVVESYLSAITITT